MSTPEVEASRIVEEVVRIGALDAFGAVRGQINWPAVKKMIEDLGSGDLQAAQAFIDAAREYTEGKPAKTPAGIRSRNALGAYMAAIEGEAIAKIKTDARDAVAALEKVCAHSYGMSALFHKIVSRGLYQGDL